MSTYRKRFLMALTLFLAWVALLAAMAVGSGRAPRKESNEPTIKAPAGR